MRKFYIVISFLSFCFFSCSSSNPKIKMYSIDVPLVYQAYSTWCVPASVLMCAEYFADIVGWYDCSIEEMSSEEKQGFILNKMNDCEGTTFYPFSNNGAPSSISNFFYRYLNINNREFAKLLTSTYLSEDYGFLENLKLEIRFEEKPLLCILNASDDGAITHAVVVTGYSYNEDDECVHKIYYNDPWYGEQFLSKSEWETKAKLNSGCYLNIYYGEF